MNTDKVTRFEVVVSGTGRVLVMYGVKIVNMELQDDDRTLKVFLTEEEASD